MSTRPVTHGISRLHALQALTASVAALGLPAQAAWPEKPIKLVVTFPADRGPVCVIYQPREV